MGVEPQQPVTQLTDEQLVAGYRAGNEAMFVALMSRYRQELYHFLVRFLSDHAAAEDIFQEAFLQVHLSIASFDIERAFRPWLFTIASNKARDYMRRSSNRSMMQIDARGPDNAGHDLTLIDLLHDQLPQPDHHIEQFELAERVREAVDALPEHLKEILILAYFHQFPYKQISEMLEIPLGTVKSRLHTAVGTFAELWQHRFPGIESTL